MALRLEGYVCIVTEANRGIGQAISVALGKEGATVYITAKTLTSSEETGSLRYTSGLIETAGGKAIPIVIDLTDDIQVSGLFTRVCREQHGRLNLFVNCGMGACDNHLTKCKLNSVYWENICNPSQEWDDVNRFLLRSAYVCSLLATKVMIKYQESPWSSNMSNSFVSDSSSTTSCGSQSIIAETNNLPTGLIVNISHLGGALHWFNVAFCAGKSALDKFSEEMSRDLKSRNINVSVINLIPGPIQCDTITNHCESKMACEPYGSRITSEIAMPSSVVGEVISALTKQSNKQLLNKSGRSFLIADLVRQLKLRSATPNIRSLKLLLQILGWRKLAFFIPSFILIPFWLIVIWLSTF